MKSRESEVNRLVSLLERLGHLAELVFSAGKADLQALDLPDPALVVRLGDALLKVQSDLLEPVDLGGVGPEQGAADARVLVLAAGAVGAAAAAEADLAGDEVGFELLPLLGGGFAVLLTGPLLAALGDEGAVVARG